MNTRVMGITKIKVEPDEKGRVWHQVYVLKKEGWVHDIGYLDPKLAEERAHYIRTAKPLGAK